MSDALKTMLGKIPSGLYILSAQNEAGEETGMLASWVQQAAFEPPTLTVAVNSKRYLLDWLKVGSTIALSQLAEGQKSLLGHFGKGFEPSEPAFEGLNTEKTPGNLTVLRDALGWVEGTVQSLVSAGDHVLLVVTPTNASTNADQADTKPWVHLRKNGLKY